MLQKFRLLWNVADVVGNCVKLTVSQNLYWTEIYLIASAYLWPGTGMAKLFEGACSNCQYISKKILSCAHGKSEEQNKILEPSINIINRY